MDQKSTEQCSFLAGQTFVLAYSLIRLTFAIIIFLLINIPALLILIRKFVSTKNSDRPTLYEAGFFYWCSACLAGTFFEIYFIFDSILVITLIAYEDMYRSQLDLIFSNIFHSLGSNLALILEPVIALKGILGIWNINLFQRRYPSLYSIIIIRIISIFSPIKIIGDLNYEWNKIFAWIYTIFEYMSEIVVIMGVLGILIYATTVY